MTQREYEPRRDATASERREVYRQTTVDDEHIGTADTTRDVYEERVAGPANDQVIRSEHVHVPSESTRRAATIARTKQIIYFIFGIINVLLALRFIFLALGASEASPFVNFIYTLSRPFVLPFQGIFGEPAFGGSVLEWASLVAIAIYMLLAYGFARVLELVYAPPRAGE
jgi:YGGT family